MKLVCITRAALGITLVSNAGVFSAPFQNLNFEQAAIVPISGTPVDPFGYSASDAVRRWTLYIGPNQVNWVLYNNYFFESTGLGIHDMNSPMTPLSGNYSLFIQAKHELYNAPNLIDASLTQTGFVPTNARSLQFKARGGNFQVSLGRQPLSLVSLLSTPTYTTYGADITPFAATSSELRFNVIPFGALFLDSIEFSDQVVPEPGALALLLCGGLGWIVWRKFATRRCDGSL